MGHILNYIKDRNRSYRYNKLDRYEKGTLDFYRISCFFLIISYNRGKEITEKSNNATENIDIVNAGSVTETQAIAIGCQFVEINVPGANDFSQKKAEPITEVQNAFYVQGHFMVNGVEYKFGVPIHYIGGEWSAHRNWEWARMEILQVGTVDLKELHGTWNYSMF